MRLHLHTLLAVSLQHPGPAVRHVHPPRMHMPRPGPSGGMTAKEAADAHLASLGYGPGGRTEAMRPKVGAPMPEGRRPDWFHVPAPGGANTRFADLKESLEKTAHEGKPRLAPVCEEAQCPNIGECWNGGTATIMLLGDTCTRGCKFWCEPRLLAAPPPPRSSGPLDARKSSNSGVL